MRIEQGVPIPPKVAPVNGPSRLQLLVKSMKVGDSIFFKRALGSTIVSRGSIWLGKGNFTTRKEGNGVRLWRTGPCPQ